MLYCQPILSLSPGHPLWHRCHSLWLLGDPVHALRWLAPLPPVIFNAVIVGAEIAWTSVGFTAAFWPAFAFNAFTVGLGELLACYILGSLLIRVLPRITFFRALIPEERLSRVAA